MPDAMSFEWWSNRADRCSRMAYSVAHQALAVTEAMFDALPWQPPDADELAHGRVIDT
jgi:hypothetical protein